MSNGIRNFKAAPDGMTARLILAFLASAGIFYVNIMPTIVDALKVGLLFSNHDAGLVAASNTYGGACGALAITFFVRRLNWKVAAPLMLSAMIGIDFISMLITHPAAMMTIRFCHGIVAGSLVGLSYSIFSRTKNPDRTFGVTLAIQTGFGGLAIMTVPLLVISFGTTALFTTLILFSAVTLILIQFLPDYPLIAPDLTGPQQKPVMLMPFILTLISIGLFQAANMGLFAFMIGLGKSAGQDIQFISESLGLAGWVSMLGGIAVVVFSTRHGIFKPILWGMVLTLIGSWALLFSQHKWIWIVSNFATGITWNFVISHLLGMCARFDRTGKSAAWAGFTSKIGLASGPMIGSLVIVGESYSGLIWMSIGAFVVATVVASIPSWKLDKSSEHRTAMPLNTQDAHT